MPQLIMEVIMEENRENLSPAPEEGQAQGQAPVDEGQATPAAEDAGQVDYKKSYEEYRSWGDRKVQELNDRIQQLESKPEPSQQRMIDPLDELAQRYNVDKNYLLPNAEMAEIIVSQRVKTEIAAAEARIRKDMELANVRGTITDFDKLEPVMKELDKQMTPAQYMRMLADEAKRRLGNSPQRKPDKPPIVEGSGKSQETQKFDPSKMSFEDLQRMMHSVNPATGKRYMDEV